jgi:hypothetical protein
MILGGFLHPRQPLGLAASQPGTLRDLATPSRGVILGLEPRIHSAIAVDARVKPEHDTGRVFTPGSLSA